MGEAGGIGGAWVHLGKLQRFRRSAFKANGRGWWGGIGGAFSSGEPKSAL